MLLKFKTITTNCKLSPDKVKIFSFYLFLDSAFTGDDLRSYLIRRVRLIAAVWESVHPPDGRLANTFVNLPISLRGKSVCGYFFKRLLVNLQILDQISS